MNFQLGELGNGIRRLNLREAVATRGIDKSTYLNNDFMTKSFKKKIQRG